MTRTRNSPPVGLQVYEADVDAIAFKRALLDLAQDFHGVFDIIMADHLPASAPAVLTMNHDGTPGRGSLLGIPIVNQVINAEIVMPTGTTYEGGMYLLAAPVRLPEGEHSLTVEVDAKGAPPLFLKIWDDAGDLVAEWRMMEDANGTWRVWPQFVTAPARYFFTVRTYGTRSYTLGGWRVFMDRRQRPTPSLPSQDGSTVYPVPIAASGDSLAVSKFHDEYFEDDYAVAAKIVSDLNRSINVLEEALTGGPIEGHDEVTNADSDDVNPTTSRFIAHTQAGTDLAAEEAIDFPLWTEAFGCVHAGGMPSVDDASPPTEGFKTWFAPFPRDVNDSIGRKATIYFPDMPDGASSDLTVDVMFAQDLGVGDPSDWECQVETEIESSAWVVPTRVGSTIFWEVSFSGLDFDPDTHQEITLRMRKTGAIIFGEIAVMGWAWNFVK